MCGITGWVDFQRDLSKDITPIRKMAQAIKHRGPDEYNEWVSTHAAFGHQRLIVVDPEGGKQPMKYTQNGYEYVLCYNGELYNTEDIRKELVHRGWTFRSHSDTEVLLKSYIEWKEECVDLLNGIFAFAIWDSEKEQLFIARDRLGVKPLFYTEQGSSLMFGSEIKALLSHDEIEPIIDHEGLSEILALGPSRTPGHGVFKGINELRAAHVGIFDKNGLRTKRYWNVDSTLHTEDIEETAQKIRYLFTDAVERQLVSDVPLGTFLSGGVDSSAITAIASNYLKENDPNRKLQTFSINYEENDVFFEKSTFQPNSDEDFIGSMVEAHGTEHHRFVMDNDTLKEMLTEAVEYRDLPGMADVDSSLLWFCRQTKQEVTVALSGECADEIFGGYPWFYREEDLTREGFPWIRSSETRHSLLNEEWKQKLDLRHYMLRRYQETIDETPLYEGDNEIESQRRKMFYLNMQWFMPNLLDRKDRMSMGASFEARVPFSDHRLVEYVWNIPWDMKTYQDREKGILRKALEGLLPDEILYRKKSPYPKTHHPAYTKAVVGWMEEILNDPKARLFELFDPEQIKKLVESEGKGIKEPWYGQLMTGPQLLAHLGQIDHWLRKYDVKIER
ncbi:asparagine synthase (glutamine-hydrolyzing) [Aquibacillus sp. 3ASR75-11]|uniref:asparagine synthase (glutamine-hydrolyzing) n=1 Tax=Terrihalobacillus insolitus TaxID=2950438 RepID=A0A9X3WWR2_9BACI|nr:asparagine synthase (glutamine-hydrolyzing) [Terrihalobacillus insolitus]MDC3413722.1 asparagine synthase (glutamine-hydrolyzing) [Terrihalobacillus insolitus]MDC3425581.1 asparagine synthase (glutamine-hydrolyzing) [Terrihalobacillus insolitus]